MNDVMRNRSGGNRNCPISIQICDKEFNAPVEFFPWIHLESRKMSELSVCLGHGEREARKNKIRKLLTGSSLQVDGSYRCLKCNFPLCSPDCAQGIHALVSAVNDTNPITTM